MNDQEHEFLHLLEGLRAGDRQAREFLLCHYLPHLERVLTYQMREYGIEVVCDVNDICQSTARRFLAAGERFRFSNEAEFFACLVRIGENLLRRRAAQTRRVQTRCESLSDTQWDTVPDRQPDSARSAAARDQWQQVQATLDDEQCEVIQQRVQGRSWRAIGKQMGITAAAARMRLQRVAERLRRKPR